MLSVCLLTRNDETKLPLALGSIAGVADEVVVVDTGSTNRTVSLAADTDKGFLLELVQCGRTGVHDRSAGFDPDIIGEPTLMNLGICFIRLGQFEKAEQCFLELLQSKTRQAKAQANLELVKDLRSRQIRPGQTGV